MSNYQNNRTYPRYFDLDGIPARITERGTVAEKFNGSEWVPEWDSIRILHATPLDQEEFEALMRATRAGTANDGIGE